MAAKGFLLLDNLADGGGVVFTASHEAGDFVVENLAKGDVTLAWRADNQTPNVVIDLGAAAAIGVVGFINSTIEDGATWRIRGATTEADLTAAPGDDSGTIAAWPAAASTTIAGYVNPLLVISAEPSYRWWRIDIDDSASSATFIDFGRLLLGTRRILTFNWQYPFGLGLADRSVIVQSEGGQPDSRVRRRARTMTVKLRFTKADLLGWAYPMALEDGITGDVLFVAEPDDPDNFHLGTIWGRVKALPDFQLRGLDVARRAYQFVERL